MFTFWFWCCIEKLNFTDVSRYMHYMRQGCRKTVRAHWFKTCFWHSCLPDYAANNSYRDKNINGFEYQNNRSENLGKITASCFPLKCLNFCLQVTVIHALRVDEYFFLFVRVGINGTCLRFHIHFILLTTFYLLGKKCKAAYHNLSILIQRCTISNKIQSDRLYRQKSVLYTLSITSRGRVTFLI